MTREIHISLHRCAATHRPGDRKRASLGHGLAFETELNGGEQACNMTFQDASSWAET